MRQQRRGRRTERGPPGARRPRPPSRRLGGNILSVDTSSDTTRTRIRLAGELDLCTLPRLHTALQGVRRDGHPIVELDLGELRFICASALQVLVDTHAALNDAGGRLVLVNPGRQVQRVLELTGLDHALETRRVDGSAARRDTTQS